MKKPLSLQILDSIDVKTPCHEDWEKMTGDSRSRFCERCQHSVNNLSEMTRKEAGKLIEQNQGKRVCVRFSRNQFGAIQFKAAASRRIPIWKSATVLAASLLGFFGVHLPIHAEETVQGDVSLPFDERVELGEMVAMPSATPTATPTPAPIERTMRIIALPEKK